MPRFTKKQGAAFAALYGSGDATKLTKPKPKKKRLYPERDQVHLPIIAWARMHHICKDYLVHFANERKCSPAQGLMLKRMGVKAGVSDLALLWPSKGYHGMWLELKAPGNKPSSSQVRWMKLMEKAGYCVGVFDSAINTIHAIRWYLNEE